MSTPGSTVQIPTSAATFARTVDAERAKQYDHSEYATAIVSAPADGAKWNASADPISSRRSRRRGCSGCRCGVARVGHKFAGGRSECLTQFGRFFRMGMY